MPLCVYTCVPICIDMSVCIYVCMFVCFCVYFMALGHPYTMKMRTITKSKNNRTDLFKSRGSKTWHDLM